ncbi:MAG: substrate-binding domain-containing protein [Desulfuromonadaceae bacterium]|nr:substrate-binding domain-containing protein [Desulfuromonadaceae bacterium]MDD5104407.1 substrate-binding domain-containing protein [Desulfuromonadaceae bacterium]
MLTLTEAGNLVYEKAEQMLTIERELLTGLKSIHEKKRIAFICTPTFGIVHLPTIMHEFMMKFNDLADLSFMFDSPNKIVTALRNGLYDLAVLEHCECFDLSELSTVALPGDDMIFVSSPVIGLPDGKTDPGTLFAQTMFTRKEGCCSRTLLEGNLRAIGKGLSDFRNFVVVDDLHMIVQATQKGQGVAFLSHELVQGQIESGQLCEHRIDGFQHHRNRTLVVNDGCKKSPQSQLEYFINVICTRFSTPPRFSS